MRILIADASMVRGIAERMVRCVNEFTHHEARCLIKASWYDHSTWNGQFNPEPPVYSLHNKDSIAECLDWCDAVHFLQMTCFDTLGRAELLGSKPASWQLFGMMSGTERWRTVGRFWKPEELKKLRLSLVAEGWQRDPFWTGKNYTMLPGIFMINDEDHKPIPFAERDRIVSFAPMNKKQRVAPKGVDVTLRALKDVPVDLLYRLEFKECMQRKSKAWLGIDELVTPMVHFSAFEYLSLGIPCASSWDSVTEHAIHSVTGSNMPFLNANVRSIRALARCAFAEDDAWRNECMAARAWMEDNYDPVGCIQKYIEFWEKG